MISKGASKLFWLICLYYSVFYFTIDGVTTTINDQIHERFGFSNSAAGNLVLVYYLQLVFVSPIIGKITDKSGNHAYWLMMVSFICMSGQLVLGVLPDTLNQGFIVILPLFLLGFADAVFETVVWSYLLLSVEPKFAAIGYGFAVSIMNLFNVFGMIGLGKVQDNTRDLKFGYYYSQMVLAGVAGIALVIAMIAFVMRMQTENRASISRIWEGGGRYFFPASESTTLLYEERYQKAKAQDEIRSPIPLDDLDV